MAKEFAKAFYNSKAWQDVRQIRIGMDRGLCRRCGRPGNEVDHIIELTPENIDDEKIALNLDNLQTLCHTCHTRKTKAEHRGNINEDARVLDKILFDENGMPRRPMPPFDGE